MAKTLAELNGKFEASAKYNLDAYNTYLEKLRGHTVKIQGDIKAVADALKACVMVPGKWYDDTAADFALWWNDVAGQSDGIDRLNGISSIMEQFIRVTALDLSDHLCSPNSPTYKSAKGYTYISKYADAKTPYIWGVQDLNKKALGTISETKTRAGVTLTADKNAITTMITDVGKNLDDINTRIDKVKKLIQTNIVEGTAIKVVDLDASVLNKYTTSIKKRLDDIQDELYVRLLEDASRHKIANNTLKSALKKDYGVK